MTTEYAKLNIKTLPKYLTFRGIKPNSQKSNFLMWKLYYVATFEVKMALRRNIWN